jgi:hypothetical protein
MTPRGQTVFSSTVALHRNLRIIADAVVIVARTPRRRALAVQLNGERERERERESERGRTKGKKSWGSGLASRCVATPASAALLKKTRGVIGVIRILP